MARKLVVTPLIALLLAGLAFAGGLPNGDIARVRVTNHPSVGQFWEVEGYREIAREPIIESLDDLLLGAPRDEWIYIRAPRQVEQVSLVKTERGRVVDEQRLGVERVQELPVVPGPEPQLQMVQSSLPAVYNYCDENECVIKDQGQCGSCWAFATNTPIQAATGQDVSEQYLVDCNTHGWGCRGGFWAFHYWTDNPPVDLPSGKVLETDAPYQAVDQECNPPYPRQDTIGGAVDIDNDIGAIKEALVANGPVGASMCANRAFSFWKPENGVFTREYGCGILDTSNHAVVIVGYDDSKSAWRVQNSWGDGWCDGGYIWMEYGASGIGRHAIQPIIDGDVPEPEPPPTITVSIEPSQLTLDGYEDPRVGYDSTRIDIVGESMTNVTGWQVRLTFDPDVAIPDLDSFEFGDFMDAPGCIKFGPMLDTDVGELFWGRVDLSLQPWKGDGTLGSVLLESVDDGGTSLHFGLDHHSPTMFITKESEILPLVEERGSVIAYTKSQCRADYAPPWNRINLNDIALMIDHYGAECGEELYREDMDWNGDCRIGMDDLMQVVALWWQDCP